MKKTKIKKTQHIIWSIDPFEQKGDTRAHILETLQALSESGAQIEPVYVLSPDEYDIHVEFNAPWIKQIRPTAEKVLAAYLQNFKIYGMIAPQILIEKRPSLRKAVTALADYAKQVKADSILVGTHAKLGLSRLFLGSFAETLLLHAQVPVLVVGPQAAIHTARSATLLFPTDFGPHALATFQKVLRLAKIRQTSVQLLHCLPHPVQPVFQSGVYLLGGGTISFPDFMTKNEQSKRKLAARYIALGKKMGIAVTVELHPGHMSTAESIVQHAQKEKSALIVMAAESGSIAATFIGSTTRQVVRSAPCPVWVLRTN